MPRPAPRGHRDNIKAQRPIRRRTGLRHPHCGGARETLARWKRHGLQRRVGAGAIFHLHEGDDAAAAHHEIQLAGRRFGPARQNAVALQLKERGGGPFGQTPAAFRAAATISGRYGPAHAPVPPDFSATARA